MKKIHTLVLVLFLAASGAQASILSPIFKIGERIFARKGAVKVVEKTAMTHLDDAARIAGHNADDLAKSGVKAGTTIVGEASARTTSLVERSVAAERAAAPVAMEIHRAPIRPPSAPSGIVRPGNVLAAGGAAAVVLGTQNVTGGISKLPPDQHPVVTIARGTNRALVLFAWLFGGGIGLAALISALPARRRRPAVIDVTPSIPSDSR